MGFRLLVLVLCLFLGRDSEVRAQSAGSPGDTGVPNGSLYNTTFGSWNVSVEDTDLPILTSQDGVYSFNLLFTDLSVSSCAAVVRHISSNVTIWVANFNVTTSRDGISTCRLEFVQDVGLRLSNENATSTQEVWSTQNVSNIRDTNELRLNNSGNLYMLNNLTQVWQWNSFADPTDTLVNGQYLNQTTMRAAMPTSNYSSGDLFYMRITSSGVTLSQNFQSNDGKTTSTHTIPYHFYSDGNISNSVYMNNALRVNGKHNSSEEGDVYLFTIPSGDASIGNPWDYARLESDGGLRLRSFVSPDRIATLYPLSNASACSLPGECGSYRVCSANGCSCPAGFEQLNSTCSRKQVLSATNCTTDQFINYTGWTSLNLSYLSFPDTDDISPEECKERCKGDCGCTNALHVARKLPNLGVCFLNITSMLTIQNVSGNSSFNQTTFLRVPKDVVAAPLPGAEGSSKSSRRTAASAFAGGAGALLLVLLGVSAWWLVHSHRKLLDDADRGKFDAASISPGELPPQFTYKELEDSTSLFNRRLGYGGHSSVYAGLLSEDNSKIAVKVLDDNNHSKEKEFLVAMATIGGLTHPNLVPLRGFCSEGKHRMLVSELVNEGRSLNYFLFRPDSGPLMDAQTRRSIALETARGLAYLHEEMVVHGGVKPENIMIDREMHPRLVDYGLINLMPKLQRLTTAKTRGYRAYMAPEWVNSPASEKVDVYSFGVVMLELVCGRSCLIQSGVPEEKRFLPTWGFSILRHGPAHLLELADPRLDIRAKSESDQQLLTGMVFIALWCVQEDPAFRPPMSRVVKMLAGDAAVDAPPVSPALDAYARELCAGPGAGARFMQSTSASENSEMRPSPNARPSGLESENSRHDLTWLLEKQQSL